MLHYYVVEVKFLDVDHKVIGAWGRDYAVPMQFLGVEIGCWDVDWFVKCESVSSRSKLHSVRLFLLGPNFADNATICDLGVLGDFVYMDERTSVSSLYVPKLLEKLFNFI